MWIRVIYTDMTGQEMGYTAWIRQPLEAWLEKKGINEASVKKMWVNGERRREKI